MQAFNVTYWQEMRCDVVSRSTVIGVEGVDGVAGLEREEITLPQNVDGIYGARGIPRARPETQLQQLVGFIAAAFLLKCLDVIRGRRGEPTFFRGAQLSRHEHSPTCI